jgi:cellulose synthase (UDP-forming)
MMRLRWWFSQQPVVLLLLSVLVGLILAVVLYRLMRRMALARKQGSV